MTRNNCKSDLSEIKLEVTHRCLLYCIHCSSNAGQDCQKEMDWYTCERILREAFDIGVEVIVFSGGEPLLWDYINKAVSLVVKNKKKLILYTTGNVNNFKQKIKNLSDIGLLNVCFSIYGANSQTHERVTKKSGSFERTLKAVKFCNKQKMVTEFHFVPLTINAKELKSIVLLGKHIGVKKTSVLRFVPQGRGEKNSHLVLNKNENLKLKKDVIVLRENGHIVRLGSPYNFLMINNSPKCCSGQDRLTISPDFKIFPCDAFKQLSSTRLKVNSDFRSAKRNLLKDCWEKSSYFETIRKCILSEDFGDCNQCPMLKKCNSGCLSQKIIEYGSFKGPDPLCLLKDIEPGVKP